MSTETIRPTEHHPLSEPGPAVHPVGIRAPLGWLRAGWEDLAAAPGLSLLYGALFAAAGAGVVALTWTLPWFSMAFVTGLLLVGPFLAAGLYGAARQREAGVPISIGETLALVWARRGNLGLFTLFLALMMAAWVRFSALLFAVKVDTFDPSAGTYLALATGAVDPVAALYFLGVGGLLALAVFVTSAVAIPLILDRDAGPVTAIGVSIRVVAANAAPMALWAGLIVALTAVGIATAFVGLAVLFPLLGYATWHSYRGLVR
jgi:uncharacterized membrane protein